MISFNYTILNDFSYFQKNVRLNILYMFIDNQVMLSNLLKNWVDVYLRMQKVWLIFYCKRCYFFLENNLLFLFFVWLTSDRSHKNYVVHVYSSYHVPQQSLYVIISFSFKKFSLFLQINKKLYYIKKENNDVFFCACWKRLKLPVFWREITFFNTLLIQKQL